MGIKKFNPITNGLREKTVITNDELSPNGALKALTFGKKEVAEEWLPEVFL